MDMWSLMSDWDSETDLNILFAYPNPDFDRFPQLKNVIQTWQHPLLLCWHEVRRHDEDVQAFVTLIMATVIYVLNDELPVNDPDVRDIQLVPRLAEICAPVVEQTYPLMPNVCNQDERMLHCFIMLIVMAVNIFLLTHSAEL